MQMVEMWMGDPPGTVQKHNPVGTGYRRFLVIEVGRSEVTLFSAPDLLNIRVARKDFERKAKPVEFNPKVLRRLIGDKVKATRKRALEPGEGRRRIRAGKAALALLL